MTRAERRALATVCRDVAHWPDWVKQSAAGLFITSTAEKPVVRINQELLDGVDCASCDVVSHIWEWDPDDLHESCCIAHQLWAKKLGLTNAS